MERHEDAVFALSKLNLDNIEKTLHEAYHQEGPGRPPRSPLGIFKALMTKRLRQIPSDRELYRRLWNDPTLRMIWDIEEREKPYHPSQLTRFRTRVGSGRLETIIIGARALFPLKKAVQSASTNDSGDICWTVPHGRLTFPANVPGIRGHHWTAAIVTATSIAHKGTVADAKVLAASMVDLLTNPELLEKAKKTFAEEMAGTEYKPLLPPGQKPPANLNKDMMAKYRPLMKPFYLRKEIRFV